MPYCVSYSSISLCVNEDIVSNIPDNLQYVQNLGDYSICEVSRRPIRNGFPTGVLSIIKRERNETEQLPEQTFKDLFLFAIGEAIRNNNFQYHYFRQDFSGTVEQNENNKPYNLREDSTDELKHFDVFGRKWSSDCSGNKY